MKDERNIEKRSVWRKEQMEEGIEKCRWKKDTSTGKAGSGSQWSRERETKTETKTDTDTQTEGGRQREINTKVDARGTLMERREMRSAVEKEKRRQKGGLFTLRS